MKIIADTNVLLRLFITDDPGQQTLVLETFRRADHVAISIIALCEMVWVLERSYGARRSVIAETVRRLLGMPKIMVDRPAAEAGLTLLDANGDFADAVIAFDGQRLGGSQFLSFDKKAVKRLASRGVDAALLSS